MTAAGPPTRSLPRSNGRHDIGTAAKHHHGTPAKISRPTFRQSVGRVFHLVRRFAIFAYAIGYAYQCFASSYVAMGLLRGRDNPTITSEEEKFEVIADFAGQDTLRRSRLVNNDALKDSTTPVQGTVYLEAGVASFRRCSDLTGTQAKIYDDTFLRSLYVAIVRDTSYHIAEIDTSKTELIAPFVDCSTRDVVDGDSTTGRFFYLQRELQDPETVHLLVVSLSNQQYTVPAQGVEGAAGVATVQRMQSMLDENVKAHFILALGYPYETLSFRCYNYLNTTNDGQWILQSIPPNEDELSITVQTANREGFYIKAESEQSNVNNKVWILEEDPLNSIGRWRWETKPVLHDSWAWVHGVQFFIGIGLLSNLGILCIATYRNFRAGKWWIGDAFVSISTAQLVNGAAVLVSWFMNEYWPLHEFCFSVGFKISGATSIYVYEIPMRVDLLTIYFSACGLIGLLLREKIDPLIAALCFHIGFDLRVEILSALPRIRSYIVNYALYSHRRNIHTAPEGQERISPMQLWATHSIGKRNYAFVVRCLSPLLVTLLLVIVLTLTLKLYKRFNPPSVHSQHTTTATSSSTSRESQTAQKRMFTIFELATGSELENRFGVVSDYETCIFIKGMKFASADGIYSTGFIIANKKFLLQTDDYWSIVLMKALRSRYKNIYAYEVNGSTVQQTARLVYPHTLTLQDLSNINVSVLS